MTIPHVAKVGFWLLHRRRFEKGLEGSYICDFYFTSFRAEDMEYFLAYLNKIYKSLR